MTSSAHSNASLDHAPRRWSLEEELALASSPPSRQQQLNAGNGSIGSLRGLRSLSPASDAVVLPRAAAASGSPVRHGRSMPVPREAHAYPQPHPMAHSVSPIGRSPLDYHLSVPPTPASSYDLFGTEPPEWLDFFQPPHAQRSAATSPPSAYPSSPNPHVSDPPLERNPRERSVSGPRQVQGLPRFSSSPSHALPSPSPSWSPSSPTQVYAGAFGSSVYPSIVEPPRRSADPSGASVPNGAGGGWMDEWLQGMGGLELDARSQVHSTSPTSTSSSFSNTPNTNANNHGATVTMTMTMATSHSLFLNSEPFASPPASPSPSASPSYARSYDDLPPVHFPPSNGGGRGRGRRSSNTGTLSHSSQDAYYSSSSPVHVHSPPPRRNNQSQHNGNGNGNAHYGHSRSYGSSDYGAGNNSAHSPSPRHAQHRGGNGATAMSPPHSNHSAMRSGRSPQQQQRGQRDEHAGSGTSGAGSGGNGNNGNGGSALGSEGKRRASASTSARDGEDPQRFDVVLERVRGGIDRRTTLMIKNIPNKYDQRMLLEKLDERYARLYDFFYLPIDFKNKCNVGYAFINFIDSLTIAAFFEDFNMRKWDRFNSEKVCRLAYARIQGKLAFIEHFRNSSLMFEDESCRPLIFFSIGPSQGLLEPFPEPTVPLRPALSEPDVGATVGDVERDVTDATF